MAIYKEKQDKLNINLTNSDNLVKIKVDCYYGTVASVSFYHESLKTVQCGETEVIGKAKDLNNSTIEFNGTANNPDGAQIKIVHTIYEGPGETVTYTFSDDYSGIPDFNSDDEHPDYKFFLNLR